MLYGPYLALRRGKWWSSWVRHCASSRKVAGSTPIWGYREFSFRPHFGPGVSLESKGGRCVGLTSSGSLNLLEPSGPVQVCNGIVFPLSTGYPIISGKRDFPEENRRSGRSLKQLHNRPDFTEAWLVPLPSEDNE